MSAPPPLSPDVARVELAARLAPIEAVVIGASAGGIEALTVLLPELAAGGRVAVLVVVHLLRERPSLLPEIFAARCRRPVREPDDKEPIAPGVIYFAPANYHMLVDYNDDGPFISLSCDDPVNYSRPSIDVLFESAAEVYGERLLGVVLSGGNHDGAAGLRAVGRAAGLTVVQDPAGAIAPTMPTAALRASEPDLTLGLPEMKTLFQVLP